jgi:hypothetical protein
MPEPGSEWSDWRKSTLSGSSGYCLEARHNKEHVQVRDSKDRDGPALTFLRAEWTAFVAGVKLGEFDPSD